MKLHPLLALSAPALLLAACSQPPKAAGPAPAVAPAASTAAAQNCVGLRQIRESVVKSDQVIDFVMLNGDILRNTLPNKCPSLGFEKAFSYATSLSQLCSTDIITVIQQGGGIRRGASCGLGQFVPITKEAADAPLTSK